MDGHGRDPKTRSAWRGNSQRRNGLSTSTRIGDVIETALTHERRRFMLTYLSDSAAYVSTEALAEYVAARENGVPRAEVSVDNVRRVRISLYHVHVPALMKAGLVRYDRDTDGVKLANGTAVGRCLDVLAMNDAAPMRAHAGRAGR